MWCIVIAFLIGFLIGCIFITLITEGRHVDGRLIIDVENPFNDQPFLLELHTNVNDVYNKEQVILEVTRK